MKHERPKCECGSARAGLLYDEVRHRFWCADCIFIQLKVLADLCGEIAKLPGVPAGFETDPKTRVGWTAKLLKANWALVKRMKMDGTLREIKT